MLAQWVTSSWEGAVLAVGFLIVWLLFGFLCASIWSKKGGNGFVGLIIGLFLGIIGLIVVAVATPSGTGGGGSASGITRECPYCKSRIPPDALVCRHCQRESDPWHRVANAWVWVNEQDQELWLDPGAASWFRVRRGDTCPHCGALMDEKTSVCPSCKVKSSMKMGGSAFHRAAPMTPPLPPPPTTRD